MSATPQLAPIQHTRLVSLPTFSECIGRLQCVGIAISAPHFSHFSFVATAISLSRLVLLCAFGGVEEFGGAPCSTSISACIDASFRGPVILSSNALLTTLTLDSAIASPASAGFSIIPKNGYSAPAATGIPRTL